MMPISENMRGALLMSAAMAAFTVNDAIMKAVSPHLPFFQAIFLRGVLTTILMLGLTIYLRAFSLRMSSKDRFYVGLRSAAEIGGTYFFISALYHMPLANVSAVLQALPLTVTLAGALVLGEKVGWRRLTAILIGFCGVLLIVRPGPEGFNLYSLYAVGAVLCVTVRDLAVRRISRDVPSLTVAWIAAFAVTLFAATGAVVIEWSPMTLLDAASLAAASVFILLGYWCSVLTMRAGDISFVAPFRYTSLLWALLLGYVLFGDWPTPLTLLGATIVVGMGIFTFWRERQLEQRIIKSAMVTKPGS